MTFCDEKNMNHITVDNYVARNDSETEVNSESVNKKVKVPFLNPAAVYYGQPKQVPSQNLLKKWKIPAGSTPVIEEKFYGNEYDITNKILDFNPNCNPGNPVPVSQQTRTTFTKLIDFLKLFFTIDVVNSIACRANAYAWKNIINKQSYANCQGAWVETNVKEIMNFIALLIY